MPRTRGCGSRRTSAEVEGPIIIVNSYCPPSERSKVRCFSGVPEGTDAIQYAAAGRIGCAPGSAPP